MKRVVIETRKVEARVELCAAEVAQLVGLFPPVREPALIHLWAPNSELRVSSSESPDPFLVLEVSYQEQVQKVTEVGSVLDLRGEALPCPR